MTTIPATRTISAQLSATELQTALRLAGLMPSRESPLAGFPPAPAGQPNDKAIGSLVAKGVLGSGFQVAPAWARALSIAAAPEYFVSLAISHGDRSEIAEYVQTAAGMGACTQGRESTMLAFPIDPAALVQSIGAALCWSDMTTAALAQIDLDSAELAALASIVDCARQEVLHAFLERRGPTLVGFSLEEIAQVIDFAPDAPDPRWLTSLLLLYALGPCHPRVELVEPGVEALTRRGLVDRQERGVVLQPPILPLCRGLSNTVPNVALTIGALQGKRSSAILIRGLEQFWVLEFFTRPDGTPWARLSSMDGPSLEMYVRSLFEMLPKQAESVSHVKSRPVERHPLPAEKAAKTQGVSCPSCKTINSAPAKFCRSCGRALVADKAAVVAPNATCQACGKTLKPEAKFCAACGFRVIR
jgi:hypothetical protein